MNRVVRFALPCVLTAAASCSSSKTQSAPAPAPTPATQAAPAGGGAGGGPGQTPGQGGARAGLPGGGRGPQMTPEQRAARRDSLRVAREAAIATLKAKIAGHDSEPAGQVFSNVQLMKDVPAVQLLNTMNAYGNALGAGCTFCHVTDQWESDDRQAKKTARTMIQIVNAINTEQLTKLPPNRNGQTPRIGCTTCHRGYTQPPGNSLVP